MTSNLFRLFSEILCNHIQENQSRMDLIHAYVMEYMALEEENRMILAGMKEMKIPVLDETIASYFDELEG
ncbi:MAG: hypothetical protein IJ683_06960 [Butyrivibrio sp.]|nr:hypothetical protein [Butyrivibrio sp.]MBR1642043.1 hypothetical protein [Butyrivibrio sp.]